MDKKWTKSGQRGKKVIFLFLLAMQIAKIGYGNNQSHYENLYKLSNKELANRDYAKAMEYAANVKVYAKENNLLDMQENAIIMMGRIYDKILDYEKAMECYLEAYKTASELSNNNKIMWILNNIGILYSQSDNFDKTVEYYNRAYQMAESLRDSSAMIAILNNMCLIFNKKGEMESLEKYLSIAEGILKNYSKDMDKLWIFSIQILKAEYLYFKKEYDLAEQLAWEALNQDVGELSRDVEIEYLLLLSKLYQARNNIPQAIHYAKESLKHDPNLRKTIDVYLYLSELYRAMDAHSLALQCVDSALIMKDSLLKLNNTSQILRGQIQFDLNNMEKKIAANKEKQKQERTFFMFIFIFLAAISILTFYIRTTKNKITKLKFEKNENEKLLLEQQLKAQESLALLEQNTHKNEMELKNKQFVSQMLFQSSKNELMEEFMDALSHIPNPSEIAGVQPIIHKMQSQMKESTSTDWDSFLTFFEQTNPAFLFTLKEQHPDLSASDIRLASYIYLNLDTKEISKLLHITPEYCMKKKQRLAQKLGLPSTKIYNYLANIVLNV